MRQQYGTFEDTPHDNGSRKCQMNHMTINPIDMQKDDSENFEHL